jgi:PAS domain S-box-containing protein
MFGYDKQELLGHPLNLLLPLRFTAAHKQHIKKYFDHPYARPMGIVSDLFARRKDGSEFPVEVSLSHLETETGSLGLAFITDISRRKQAEWELKLRNEELDSFAHTVAHDMKSSVSILVGFAEYLAEIRESLTQEQLEQFLKQMAIDGRKLINIIDGLLLFASIRKQDVQHEALDMGRIVSEALRRLRYQIQDSQAEVVVPDKYPVVLGYPQWVEEIWFNYLSNGLKYGGSPPRLEIGWAIQGDKHIKFWVKDNGKGLTQAEQQALFKTFTRVGDLKIEGYGLGLSIVRRIIDKLNGQVAVESTPGEGSTFSFTLPCADTENT